MKKAVIYDMDGVIVDAEHLHKKADIATCQEFNLYPSDELWDTFFGMSAQAIFRTVDAEVGDGSAPIADMVEFKDGLYVKLFKDVMPVVPDALACINHCVGRFDAIALATSSSAAIQTCVFDALRLHKKFSVVVTGDDVVHGKPEPEPYLLAAEKLGLDPTECYVIEDSDNGVKSAVAAGCTAIGITTSFSREALLDAGATHVARSHKEIIKLL